MTRKAADVVNLGAVRLAPVPEVVEALEDALARARAGEVRGFVIAGAADRGADFSSYAIGDGNIATLVLGLERAKKRLLEAGQ